MEFGEQLRMARERKGYDLPQAARRLRIRPDILQAIENNDFDNMPPRGYTRNMVNAYARLVGLNPTEITRQYLDEAYAHQSGQARTTAQGAGSFDMGGRSRSPRSSRDARSGSRGTSRSGSRTAAASGQTRASSRSRTGDTYRYADPGRSRARGSAPTTEYTNFYAGPSASSYKSSKLPFFVAGAAVLVLLVVVLVIAFGCSKDSADEDASTIPISGMSDTTETDEESSDDATAEEEEVQATAPTSATFAYEVLDGSSAYIEVYLDDEGASVAATIDGPAEESYEVTGTLKFVTTNPDGVVATVDGEEVTPEDAYGKGVYTYTVDFSEILAAWEEENGVSSSSDDSDGSGGEDADAEADDADSGE